MLKAIQNRTRDDKGFTLIELMVVVLIIAILIAIAIPTFLGMRRRAQDRAAQSDLRNGITAAKAFFTDEDTYVPVSGAFDVADGEATEPSLDWMAADPVNQRDVKIHAVTPTTVHLTSVSNSGTYFCIFDTNGQTTFGSGTLAQVNAAAGAGCLAQSW
jgi:type IV pilus assembly protein PilA